MLNCKATKLPFKAAEHQPQSKTWRMFEAPDTSRQRLGLRVLLHRFSNRPYRSAHATTVGQAFRTCPTS